MATTEGAAPGRDGGGEDADAEEEERWRVRGGG